jgi:hypothetical protein
MNKTVFLCVMVFATCLAGCSKDEGPDVISLKITSVMFSYGNKHQIEATSKKAITYTVEDEFHAEVSETGLVTAGRIGETDIILSNGEDTKKIHVTVRPKYSERLYPEPNVKLGDTKSSILAKFGYPDDEDEEFRQILYYAYDVSAPVLIFSFDESDMLDNYRIIMTQLRSSDFMFFFSERYLAVSEKDGTFLFINSTKPSTATLAIECKPYSESYWQVTYSNALLNSVESPIDANKFAKLLKNRMLNLT